MTDSMTERVYHRLVVVADPETVIWLVDDIWHPVQKAIGTLDTRVIPGHYFIDFWDDGDRDIAYPIHLHSDLRLTKEMLEAGPTCKRQAPKLLDE